MPVTVTRVFFDLEAPGYGLGHRIGGHDGAGGGHPAVLGESREGDLDGLWKACHRKALTDDPGGKRQHLFGGASAGLRHRPATAARIRQTLLAGTGIGVAGIDQQIARRLALEVLTGDDNRGGTECVASEHRGHTAFTSQLDDSQIVSGFTAHTQGCAAQAQAGHRFRIDFRAQSNRHTSPR